MIALLITWFATIAIASLPLVATWRWLRQHGCNDICTLIALPLITFGLLGYTTFFAFVLNPLFGKIVAITLGVISPCVLIGKSVGKDRPFIPPVWPKLLAWMCGCGLIYLSILYLPELPWPAEHQSAIRFNDGLPEDATIPKTLADRMYTAQPIKPFIIDWLSSDRPPLQTGIYLQIRSCLAFAPLDAGLLYQCVGTWVQLFWIPAVWLVCQHLKLSALRTACVLGLIACTGFTLLNSTYVWPKLIAGAYGLIAGVLLITASERTLGPKTFMLAASAAALGWLAHGGVVFSLLALVPLLASRAELFKNWRSMAAGAAIFVIIATPWLAYQKYYDPPGNRLLKWHLAGVRDLDSRTFYQTLRESYASLDASKWIKNKSANFQRVAGGDFVPLVDFIASPAKPRRIDEFFHVIRALGVLNTGWVLLAWLILGSFWRARLRPTAVKNPCEPLPDPELNPALAFQLTAWFLLTIAIWAILIFEPGATVIHQGSYTMMLTALVLTAAAIASASPVIATLLSAWHIVYFVATWPVYFGSAAINFPMLAGIVIGLIIVAVTGIRTQRAITETETPLRSSPV